MPNQTDAWGAFVAGPCGRALPTAQGPLDGLTFALKDLIDVAGTVTGGGHPDCPIARAPATAHPPAVQPLPDARRALVGTTVTAHLAFTLWGAISHTRHNRATPLV